MQSSDTTAPARARASLTAGGLSRRAFLAGSVGAAGIAAMPGVAFATPTQPSRGDVLVLLHLDGGMDALSALVPFTNNTYYSMRPQTSISGPGTTNGCLQIDDKYGFHPALAALKNGPWAAGDLAFVQAAGVPEAMGANRSHFFMTELFKRAGRNQADGWATRHLQRSVAEDPMVARSWGTAVDETLSGYGSALGGWSLAPDIYRLANRNAVMQSLETAFAGSDPAAIAGQTVLDAMAELRAIDFRQFEAPDGVYPDTGLGWKLRNTAALIRSGVGTEVVTLNVGGYDTHDGQGNAAAGNMIELFDELSSGLTAFYNDLGPARNEVTVVAMSEFGRQIPESGSAGTDHGAGGGMIIMGGNVNGGLYGPDSPIDPAANDDVVPVLVDYQTVLAEILAKRRGETNVQAVFPNITSTNYLGVCS